MTTFDSYVKKLGPKRCASLSRWIRDRIREMEPDRETIHDEYGFALLDHLEELAAMVARAGRKG